LPYYLDEETNWTLNIDDVQKQIDKSVNDGITVRAIVVINPGNPTGQVMDRPYLEQIAKLCYDNEILIIADEVY